MRVSIIEDLFTVREGLAYLIAQTPGYSCSGAYRSVEDALRSPADAAPDVALVDIGLPGMSGIEGLPLLHARWPKATILMLTVLEDDRRVVEAICAGAHGYLLKKTPPARIVEALEQAASGGSPISPEVARRVLELFRVASPQVRHDYGLTAHETRLLALFVDGHNYKSAALELNVSVNTIGFHVRKIYQKLEVHSKSEAVSKALREKLLG
jgi:DNA-binding NarL/FixJ family response regulator